MTLQNSAKAPFPWFGGKSKAAPLVWALLGDTDHYVEPFFGSGAVLLGRPHPCNRPYFSETVNDADGMVCNFWRSIQFAPDATAEAASWPVIEADKSARQIALLRWRDGALDRLAGSADWCDPVMAGWWAWAVSVQIGAFTGDGPWTVDPVSGRIFKQARTDTRVPGVSRDLPHIANGGRGVNHPSTRVPGVGDDPEFHPVTMPDLRRWFAYLSARLRHVRVLNGDWSRLATNATTKTLNVWQGGVCGVFLDPPYADAADRANGLYAVDSLTIAHDVSEWCLTHGDDPDYRIVLAGFDGEHGTVLTDAGWTEHEWFTHGFLTGGYGNIRGASGHQQHRERLWASPHCLALETGPVVTQETLW